MILRFASACYGLAAPSSHPVRVFFVCCPSDCASPLHTINRLRRWGRPIIRWQAGDDSGGVHESALGETDNPLHVFST